MGGAILTTVSTITSDSRPVFKARLVLVHPHYDEHYVYFTETISTFVKRLMIGLDWRSE